MSSSRIRERVLQWLQSRREHFTCKYNKYKYYYSLHHRFFERMKIEKRNRNVGIKSVLHSTINQQLSEFLKMHLPQNEVLWPVCDYGYDLFGPEPLKCSAANFGGDVNTCVRPTVDCVIPMISNGKFLRCDQETT